MYKTVLFITYSFIHEIRNVDVTCSEIRVSNEITLTYQEFHSLLNEKLTLLPERDARMERERGAILDLFEAAE
jgi:hypothetical protein